MLRIYSLISGVIFFFFSPFIHSQTFGLLNAVDDATSTGPMQSVRINVIANDTTPCIDNYTWRIITETDPVKEGLTEKQGDYIVFKPSFACRDTTVKIAYAIKCGGREDMATLVVTVTNYNRPINILPPDLKCWMLFPPNIQFDVNNKFNSADVKPNHNNRLLVYSLPLVGDLNGDMKPEIIAIGLETTGATRASAKYITIMDGQTGKTLVEYDTKCTFAVSGDQPTTSAYHSSPSYMAIADVDNDGTGEIIMAFPVAKNDVAQYSEQVVTFKVETNSANEITGLRQHWKAPVGYKAPLTETTHLVYDVPAPYIADLNGDGIPEVIVYNKIYNAQTGRLLMAWDGPASSPRNSSLASGTGLRAYKNGNIYTPGTNNALTSDTVYKRAFTGRRPSTSTSNYKDDYIAVFAVENMDDDEDLEVIAGNRIYKFQFNYLGKDDEAGSHEDNTYTTVEGPRYVVIPTTGNNSVTYYLSDGFTRVADIDGDGYLDVVNISEIATTGSYGSRAAGLISVWDPRDNGTIKAASVFHGNGGTMLHIPAFGIPFIGDINGKTDGGWDGTQFTKKLPEIGLLTSTLFINASNSVPKRNGITFHPLSDINLRQNVDWDNNSTSKGHFNRSISNVEGHIFAVTYCDSAGLVPYNRRLKLSWAMEHADRSANTGLTIFDFNNDGAKDLIYRDEKTLRVISPKYGGKDYVEISETVGQGNDKTSIMFRTPAYSFTGYEAAIVADVNMDASADIVVTNTQSIGNNLDGWISVFEYKNGFPKWAPAPSVWNQAYYNPRHIMENLSVPSRPTPALTTYEHDAGEMIQPYNGAWEQQPFVREGDPYRPVVRQPDALAVNMAVKMENASYMSITLTIRNMGAASINANTPITLYDGNMNPGYPIDDPHTKMIGTIPIGIDIFPGESVIRTYTLSYNGKDRLIWARIMDDKGTFPANGFTDCNWTNNTASGAYCPDMNYIITLPKDAELCGNGGSLTLTAIPTGVVKYDRTYQWFLNEHMIIGATDSTYTTSIPGSYTCFVTEGICRQYTPVQKVVTRFLEAFNDNFTVLRGITASIRVLANDSIPSSCTPVINIETEPAHGDAVVVGKKIHYTSDAAYLGPDEFVYSIADSVTATVYINVTETSSNTTKVYCRTDSPGSPFSIKQLAASEAADTVYSVATPLAGDIDNDGITEIIVAGGTYPNNYTSNSIKIFEVKNNRIELQQELTVPGMGGIYAAPFTMAKVDENDYAAIFLCTRSESNAAADRCRLIKYTFDGTSYAEQYRTPYSSVPEMEGGIPYIADFNGDGRAEVVVYDKVFDARTLTLLADGNLLDDPDMGFGAGGYPATGTNYGSYMAVGDLDGDGLPEIAAGNCVYKVNIINSSDTTGNSFTLWSKCDGTGPDGESHGDVGDGATAIADMDGDERPDVIVTVRGGVNTLSNNGSVYVWNPRTKKVIHKNTIDTIAVKSTTTGPSAPSAGDLDNDGEPEICFTGYNKIYAFGYDASTKTLSPKWSQNTADGSACTRMSLFDFNQNGSTELVYRDKTHLRILSGADGTNIATVAVASETGNEYPVVADVNNDGVAEIVAVGSTGGHGYLCVFSCDPAGTWAPARKIWNHLQYDAVNVDDDLTIPRYRSNPANIFPGTDKTLDTDDDVRPYNAFLQQQTVLDKNGMPVWFLPDAYPDPSLTTSSVAGNSVTIHAGIVNQGDAAIGSPVYVTLYNENTTQKIITESADIRINPRDTGYVSVTINEIKTNDPVNILIRVNDYGSTFLNQPECDSLNNDLKILNPVFLHKKEAILEGEQNNGVYKNPISILYHDTLEYKITALNTNSSSSTVVIVDTLPAFMHHETGSISDGGVVSYTSGTPSRHVISWTFTDVPPMTSKTVSVKAMPGKSVCISQPLFINKAWVTTTGTGTVATNRTYHQGAGAGVITFSAGTGGNIYNAQKQVLDYKTKPEGGIIVAPDEGYRFTGWSYDEYVSLKGKPIGGRKGITQYDTITVYGNVELKAVFELEEYPIHYFLNGSKNPGNNPPVYTIKSGAIALEAPEKTGDVFIGWTGSNGDVPQPAVTIPEGSTGERNFYANFLHSGHENEEKQVEANEDRIWAVMNELHIRTTKTGNIVKIYTPDGKLQETQTILSAGETTIKLQPGIYIVTLNDNTGRKINIK